MADRTAFLTRVEHAVETANLPEVPGGVETAPRVTPPSLPDVDMVEHFCAQVGAVDGVVHRVTEDQVSEVVLGLMADHDASRALVWDDDQLPVRDLADVLHGAQVEILDARAPSGDRTNHNARNSSATVGITGATAALAESGSLVLTSGAGRPRMASLLPPVHIALVRASDLHRSLTHFMVARPEIVNDGANLLVITGPSRTGDIEMQLTLGVHGPKHLYVLVIEQTP